MLAAGTLALLSPRREHPSREGFLTSVPLQLLKDVCAQTRSRLT